MITCQEAASEVFVPGRTRKEYGFGPWVPNRKAVGGIVPVPFLNGEEHARVKHVGMELMRLRARVFTFV